MDKAVIAAIANFFLPGLGYLIGGVRGTIAFLWLVGVGVLTYVELQLQALDQQLFFVMFGAVFVMNIAFAVDAYRAVRSSNA